LRKICLFLFICWCPSLFPSPSSAKSGIEGVYVHGSGWPEVVVFSDYFCGGCYDIEPAMEDVLTDLSNLGAKIVFVDYPSSLAEAVFSKYFLYSANADGSLNEMLRTRRILFELAQGGTIKSERQLIQELQQKEVQLEPMKVNPILRQWNDLIQQHEIMKTPASAVSWPPRADQRHVGVKEAIQGLMELLEELEGSGE
jgi:Asp-tRNA(Asn)/Glu-tRNA(Gln) amidotransferase A subunit family amidase